MYAIVYWKGNRIYPVLDYDGTTLKTFERVLDADKEADKINDSRVISIEGVEE